jgi:hypothetical protein
VESPQSEEVPLASEQIAEAIEEVSSDAVAIAEIEANKEITIAAIEADTRVAVEEAAQETAQAAIDLEKERVTWQEERIAALETEVSELKSLLILAPSIPQVLEEEALQMETDQPTVEEPNSIPQFTSELIAETPTAALEESEADAQEVAEAVRRKFRAI